MKPTTGRIVHYLSHGSPVLPDGSQKYEPECRAAIITAVPKCLTWEPLDGCPNGTDGQWEVSLAAINPTGFFFHEVSVMDETVTGGGSWHWPERGEDDILCQIPEGVATIEEGRKELGLKPWGLPETGSVDE